jgi:ATP-dependent DNA helicase RecQ
MQEIQSILKTYWGFSEFRPLQKEIIDSVLEGKDTLALLPTGGGKSICFQVPALAQDGICLVISPLIALMKDQVENLKKKGILAAAIYSGMSRGLMIQTLKNIAYGPYKFLYISPERIETSLFQEYLPAFNVNLIAVDEAHCISQWGYDFRPSYLRIASLRECLPGVPVLALTASATEEVQKDICEKLDFKEQIIFRPSFHRKNLSYSVFPVDVKMKKLLEILTKVPGSSLVYCKSRKRTVETANLLQMHGLSAQAYHAGLSQEERNKRQQEWVEGKIAAMVCTNAFGMGIDKPDVRTVVHIDVPDCLENYYQEAGRAGRDGNKSYAVLLYGGNDLEDLKNLHTKRFPSFDQIKEVYGALGNYLQIAINTGEGNSYPFYFEAFIKNFKLDSHTALYSLKTLEQDGWLDFNEKNFSPSTIVFTTNKEQLYQFQESYPEYEPLLTTLLRTYEGIFGFPSFISENLLSRLLRVEEEKIKDDLKKLTAFHIIEYVPQNDAPFIILKKNRVATENLTINLLLYKKRKEAFIGRVKKIVDYTQTKECRSIFVNHYFGDHGIKSCGICDNCRRAKALHLTTEEFEKIKTSIYIALKTKSIGSSELLGTLQDINKEKAWSVLNFLQAEQKVFIDEKGKLSLS